MRWLPVAAAALELGCASAVFQTHQRGTLSAVSTKAIQLPMELVTADAGAESCGVAIRTPYLQEAVEEALAAAPGADALVNLSLEKTSLTCYRVDGSAVVVRPTPASAPAPKP